MCFLAEFCLIGFRIRSIIFIYCQLFHYYYYLFIYLFIVYVLCDGETQEDWDTLDFMQVTGMIEWGPDKNQKQ